MGNGFQSVRRRPPQRVFLSKTGDGCIFAHGEVVANGIGVGQFNLSPLASRGLLPRLPVKNAGQRAGNRRRASVKMANIFLFPGPCSATASIARKSRYEIAQFLDAVFGQSPGEPELFSGSQFACCQSMNFARLSGHPGSQIKLLNQHFSAA